MNLPNKLTLLRIIAIPVFIVVLLLGYQYTATIPLYCRRADGHAGRTHRQKI